MGLFDSISSAVSSFASSVSSFVSSVSGGSSSGSKTNTRSSSSSSSKTSKTQTTTNGGNARSNSAVNSKYQKPASTSRTADTGTVGKTTESETTKPTISGTVDGITTGKPTIIQTSTPAATGGNARSNSAVNSKYTTETTVHSSAKEYTNPADTVPKTSAPIAENKVYDSGGKTTAATSYAVESGAQKNMEVLAQIAETTASNNSIIPGLDQSIAWRNEQYDKTAEYLSSGNFAEAAASFLPAFLADVALPLDALNVTNKMGAVVAGISDEANLSEYELQIGGIDAAISAIPIIGPAQRVVKTISKSLGAGTKAVSETAETAAGKAFKEIAEETGESALSKVAKEGTEDTANYAVKNTPAYKVARVIDNVATPIVGTVATFALSDSTASETPGDSGSTDADETNEDTNPSPFDFSEAPDTDIWEGGNFWEGGTADAGETSWSNYGADENLSTSSAGIDTEIDRIIKDYAAPAFIAFIALAALAVMNYALSKKEKNKWLRQI